MRSCRNRRISKNPRNNNKNKTNNRHRKKQNLHCKRQIKGFNFFLWIWLEDANKNIPLAFFLLFETQISQILCLKKCLIQVEEKCQSVSSFDQIFFIASENHYWAEVQAFSQFCQNFCHCAFWAELVLIIYVPNTGAYKHFSFALQGNPVRYIIKPFTPPPFFWYCSTYFQEAN